MRFHGVPREAQETPFQGILTQLHPSKEEAHKSTHRLGRFGGGEECSGREHRECSWASAFTCLC